MKADHADSYIHYVSILNLEETFELFDLMRAQSVSHLSFFLMWCEHEFSTTLRAYMCSLMELSYVFLFCVLYKVSPFMTSRQHFCLTRKETERRCFSKVFVEVEPFPKLKDYKCDGLLDGMLGSWLSDCGFPLKTISVVQVLELVTTCTDVLKLFQTLS